MFFAPRADLAATTSSMEAVSAVNLVLTAAVIVLVRVARRSAQ